VHTGRDRISPDGEAMPFAFEEHERLLEEAARHYASSVYGHAFLRAALDDKDGRVRAESWSRLAGLGWTGILVSERLGGGGGSVVDACILAEALAGSMAPVPFVATAMGAASVLTACDDDEGLIALAAGRPMCLTLDSRLIWPSTQPNLAWDWLPDAEIIQLGPENAVRRTQAVPTQLRGPDPLHPLAVIDDLLPNDRTSAQSEAVRRALVVVRAGLAASASGLARTALAEAVSYARVREQYGRPIAEFQAVQHICADMLVDAEATRSIAFGAAWAAENEGIDEAERVAAAATAWCGPAAIRVVESSIQVLGGIGVTWENDAHLRLRHAQLLGRLLGGAADAQKELGRRRASAAEKASS